MSEECLRRQTSIIQRNSTISSVVLRTHRDGNKSHGSDCASHQRQLSTLSQMYLPYGSEYSRQDRLPPIGPEAQQAFLAITVDDDDEESIGEGKRISILTRVYSLTDGEIDEEYKGKRSTKKTRRILFIVEPMIGAFFFFPIIALFWLCGWNLTAMIYDCLNESDGDDVHLNGTILEDCSSCSWKVFFFPYLIIELILLIFYLGQNIIYDYLEKRSWIIQSVLLQIHIFILSTAYIIQWTVIWTVWDNLCLEEWYLELIFSLTSLFAFLVFNGHLSDLVCSPFLFSYDSIECAIQFGCPLLTREMKKWKINLINFVFYEIILSNLSILTWRGFYNILDKNSFPNDLNLSIGLSLFIGYLLYFPLMYFQTYLEELNIKYEFWTFISINFPQFYRNIRHFLAFVSCVFLWRGYWVFYDSYIYLFDDYFKTYILFYIFSFLVLSIAQTSSSINGPLSHIDEMNHFFPLYPHCYVSSAQRKLSQLFSSKVKMSEEIYVF